MSKSKRVPTLYADMLRDDVRTAAKYLYDIFLTLEKNNCSDLSTMALPMLMSDARTGIRQYTAEETDVAALHADFEALTSAQGELRRFMGRHGRALSAAFQIRDRAQFDTVVAECSQNEGEGYKNAGAWHKGQDAQDEEQEEESRDGESQR